MNNEIAEKPVTPGELSKINRLMIEAFPEAERSCAKELFELSKDPAVSFSAYYNSDCFLGFSFSVHKYGFLFLYYIAVVENCRCKGYGTEILKNLCSKSDAPLIVNIESLKGKCRNGGQRLRRLELYKRCGLNLTGHHLIHDCVEYDIICSRVITKNDMDNYKKLLMSISLEYASDTLI